MQVRELEKQIVRVRSHGPLLRGSALLAQGDASLPFIAHMSEQLVTHNNPLACSDMQRQRSQSGPTVTASLRRTSSDGREWEQPQGEPQLQNRVGRQGRPHKEPPSSRGSQAVKSLGGSQVTSSDTSQEGSETEQSHPDAVKTVCSNGRTAHARGVSTDPRADTVGEMQPADADGVLEPEQQELGKYVSHPELSAVQIRKDRPGMKPAVQGLQAGKVASQLPTNCSKEVATSPVGGAYGHGPKAHSSHIECSSSSGTVVVDVLGMGIRTIQTYLKEQSVAGSLHEERVLAGQCEALAGSAGSQSCGSAANAAGAEDAELEVMPPRPGAGSGRRSKPFAYGPRTQPAPKAIPGSGIYGIAANGSAASTQTHHAPPDADVPARGSITAPRKPFAYGPRGLLLHDAQPNAREDVPCLRDVEDGHYYDPDV